MGEGVADEGLGRVSRGPFINRLGEIIGDVSSVPFVFVFVFTTSDLLLVVARYIYRLRIPFLFLCSYFLFSFFTIETVVCTVVFWKVIF